MTLRRRCAKTRAGWEGISEAVGWHARCRATSHLTLWPLHQWCCVESSFLLTLRSSSEYHVHCMGRMQTQAAANISDERKRTSPSLPAALFSTLPSSTEAGRRNYAPIQQLLRRERATPTRSIGGPCGRREESQHHLSNSRPITVPIFACRTGQDIPHAGQGT